MHARAESDGDGEGEGNSRAPRRTPENEVRKDFTPSERVAIGREIERQIGSRQGQRTDRLPENIPEVPKGTETRQIAAERAGFGNETTYRQAKAVVDKAHPDVVAAMDAGEIAISAGAALLDR